MTRFRIIPHKKRSTPRGPYNFLDPLRNYVNQNDQATSQPTDGHEGSKGSYTINNGDE